MQQLYIGATLQNGKYRIVRVLGQGGFGITYLASYANTLVAIKEFFPESLCCRKSNNFVDTLSITQAPLILKFKKKFIKEANRIKALSHPNIIRCYEAFEENGTAYYVMEYVEGYNLNEFVSQRGSYSVDSANDIINQIGSALTYIHQQRMTHLDVKPANIVWSTQKRKPILIDFGISKQYDFSGEATSTTPVGFSKGYAPIEQYAQGGVDEFSPQTDVYSLAATYYYLLTGMNPPDATEILMTGLSNPGGKLSNCFSAIKKAMSPKKSDRYSSVKQLVDALLPNQAVFQTEIPRNREEIIEPASQNFNAVNNPIPKSEPVVSVEEETVFVAPVDNSVTSQKYPLVDVFIDCTRGYDNYGKEMLAICWRVDNKYKCFAVTNNKSRRMVNSYGIEILNNVGDTFFLELHDKKGVYNSKVIKL